jgi:uncharacterized protein YcbX
MNKVGTIESLWRYPVKSMAGQQLESAYAGYSGIYGDRIYAIHDAAAPAGFPWLTAREQEHMLLFHPIFRHPERAAQPPNQAEAESSGATPLYAASTDLMVDVRTPDGKTLTIDDPALLELLRDGLRERHQLRLLSSERSLTDCSPVSLLSIQTTQTLADELSIPIDKRRFRANVYLDLNASGFAEDQFVGRTLRIGAKVTLSVLKRDSRCKIITLDPETAEANPEVMKQVARAHERKVGIYAAVLVEGTIRPGDEVHVID